MSASKGSILVISFLALLQQASLVFADPFKPLDEMDILQKEEIEQVISDHGNLKNKLLESIDQKTRAHVKTLIGKEVHLAEEKNKDFGAAYLANYTVNIGAMRQAAKSVVDTLMSDIALGNILNYMTQDDRDVMERDFRDLRRLAEDSEWEDAAGNASPPITGQYKALWGPSAYAAWDVENAAMNEAITAASGPTVAALAKLELKDPSEIVQKSFLISQLLSLNWARKENSRFVTAAYNLTKAAHNGGFKFRDASASLNLRKPELATNSYIVKTLGYVEYLEAHLGTDGDLSPKVPPAITLEQIHGEYEVTSAFQEGIESTVTITNGEIHLKEKSRFGLLGCKSGIEIEGFTLKAEMVCDNGSTWEESIDFTGVDLKQKKFTVIVKSSLFGFKALPFTFTRMASSL